MNGISITLDGKTTATEEQIESKETQIIEFEKREYLVQHVILSTMSSSLGALIKDLRSAREMWEKVKAEPTTKSMLYLINGEDQLAKMKLSDNNDPKVHLAEVKQHFQLLVHWLYELRSPYMWLYFQLHHC